MSIGKYLTNVGVIGALLGVFGTLRQTRQMPNDWRRIIVWAAWALGLALALGGVAKQSEDEHFEAEQKQQRKVEKAQTKAARKGAKR